MPCYVLIVKCCFIFCLFVCLFERQPTGDGRIQLEWLVSSMLIWFQKQKFVLLKESEPELRESERCWAARSWGKMDAPLYSKHEHTESRHALLRFSCPVHTQMPSSVVTEPLLLLFAHKIVGYNCITINTKYPNCPPIKCVFKKKKKWLSFFFSFFLLHPHYIFSQICMTPIQGGN